MSKNSAKKFSFKKFLKVLGKILLCIAGVLLILFIIFHKLVLDGFHLLKMSMVTVDPDALEYTEMHLTREQMLTDFEYFYDHLYTDSFVREEAERYLGLDYAKIHDEYEERISNCKDEYEFYCLMMSLSAKLPGAHNCIQAPTNTVPDSYDFPLGYEVNAKEVIDSNYSFYVQFEDRMFSFDQKFMYFCYFGGDYVAISSDFDKDDLIPGIENGRLLTLNGQNVEDVLDEIDTVQKYAYDAACDRVFSCELLFNDSYGKKYVAEIELPDGSIVTMDLYNSCEHVAACQFRNRLYPNHNSDQDSDEDKPEEGVSSEQPQEIKRCYSIEKVPERDLIVITIKMCDSNDIDAVREDITNALNEVNPSCVIIDNRNNKGGAFTFVTDGLCPVLFNHDYEFVSYARTPINDMTDMLYGNSFYTRFFENGLKREADHYCYNEDFSFKGEAARSYDIYLLNGLSTFSSGDILAGIFSQQPEVTVIGNNTHGEGFSGHPMNYYLPESKFIFSMTFSVSEAYPDDNYLGTVPDIYVANTWNEWLKKQELTDDPDCTVDLSSFEGRLMWDAVMIKTYELIENK